MDNVVGFVVFVYMTGVESFGTMHDVLPMKDEKEAVDFIMNKLYNDAVDKHLPKGMCNHGYLYLARSHVEKWKPVLAKTSNGERVTYYRVLKLNGGETFSPSHIPNAYGIDGNDLDVVELHNGKYTEVCLNFRQFIPSVEDFFMTYSQNKKGCRIPMIELEKKTSCLYQKSNSQPELDIPDLD